MGARLPQTRQIARFALRPHALEAAIADQLKRHLLDSLGSLAYSLTQETPRRLQRQIKVLGEGGPCAVPGIGWCALDRSAQWLTALIRYPDFMDNFLGQEATCHPSDNIGGLLAAGLLAGSSGEQLLDAMAVAYEIECRLTDVFPVMKHGFDHTVLLAHSQTAGMGRLLGLKEEALSHALAIVGCSFLSLAAGRASGTPQWKGFASSLTALGSANSLVLAAEGLTGPPQLFEGPVGYDKSLKMKLEHDWGKENFELIPRCILKAYNAEVHSQSAIDALLNLRRDHGIDPASVERIEATVFHTCKEIIGGGEYGDRHAVHSKEQADHSLPYLLAVALLDGDVGVEQLTPERIERDDVQQLLAKVKVDTVLPDKTPDIVREHADPLTRKYPQTMPVRIEVKLSDGTSLKREQDDYPGFHTRPLGWPEVEAKFRRLSQGLLDARVQDEVIECVRRLEDFGTSDLMALIGSSADAANDTGADFAVIRGASARRAAA